MIQLPAQRKHSEQQRTLGIQMFEADDWYNGEGCLAHGLPEVEVPEEWQPPSIDALWTANLAEDLFQQHPPQQQTWDDASLAELVLGE